MPERKVQEPTEEDFRRLSEVQFKLYNNLRCPFCSVGIGFGEDVVGKSVECPKCKKRFSFEDGFIEHLAAIPLTFHRILCTRLGLLQSGRTTVKIGELQTAKFTKPFFKLSGVYLTDPEGRIYDTLETDDYVVMPVQLANDGFRILSSGKNYHSREVTVNWIASGSRGDLEIPIWHIFLQNTIDLLNKGEYATAIVMAITTFDCYLDDLLVDILSTKHGLPEDLVKRIVLSPKFGRDEHLSYWMKSLLGKSFTEDCPMNDALKEFADMRRDLVHPPSKRVDEKVLTEKKAEECIDVVIKSIKWINDLRLGKL
jgi:hypothetical protein